MYFEINLFHIKKLFLQALSYFNRKFLFLNVNINENTIFILKDIGKKIFWKRLPQEKIC